MSAQTHFHIQQHELLTPETFNPTESLKYHYTAAAQRAFSTVISLVMSQHGIRKSQEWILSRGEWSTNEYNWRCAMWCGYFLTVYLWQQDANCVWVSEWVTKSVLGDSRSLTMQLHSSRAFLRHIHHQKGLQPYTSMHDSHSWSRLQWVVKTILQNRGRITRHMHNRT